MCVDSFQTTLVVPDKTNHGDNVGETRTEHVL